MVFTFWRTGMENFPSRFTETMAGISFSFLYSQEVKIMFFWQKGEVDRTWPLL